MGPVTANGFAPIAVTPCAAGTYAHHFLHFSPCIPASLGYNRGMKRQMIEEEKAARLRCMAFGLVFPGVILLGITIEKIFS